MKDKKEEITIKSIFKWLRSDKGKKYSFFIFYIFFFIFLFIMLSFGGNTTSLNKEKEFSLPFSVLNFESNSFTSTLEIDFQEKTEIYLIKKEANTISLTKEEEVYLYEYQNGNLVFMGEEAPVFPQILDIYEIKKIIKSSKLISETKLADTNEFVYTYHIKTKDLMELLDYKDMEVVNNLENDIVVSTDSKKEVRSICFKINEYEITLTYGETHE